jgi:hypothetical protein
MSIMGIWESSSMRKDFRKDLSQRHALAGGVRFAALALPQSDPGLIGLG